MKTTDNTMLITGGTSGLGLGLAQRFHAAGNTVIIAGRRADLLEEIVAAHPGMESIVLDVNDPGSITAAHASVTAAHPELNVLINMAGIMLPENLLDGSALSVAEDTITTNLLGPIRMLNAFVPFLVAQDEAVIMNVSSGLAFVPLPFTPTYNATKAAIHSYTQSLRVQLAESSVQVLELVPPAVQTALMGQTNDERAMPLEDYLSEVMTLIADRPESGEILVERVKFLRFAEADGRFDDVLAMLSSH
ncbi:SDR family oxidoreductase [Aeromicrobium sp. CF3.5]|uniref:SDR family oxidoreductase n=1 Tax=Aeromicrobium sp. CF3.5 TaxID=3373078 RepID=UPI003EE5A0F2